MQNKFAIAAVVGLLGMGILAVTNPNQSDYTEFATKELILYAKDNLCQKVPLGLSSQCQGFLQSNQSQIHNLIEEGTHRRNYGLFSLYQTDLSISALVPSYRVEAIGIMHQFLLVKVKQR